MRNYETEEEYLEDQGQAFKGFAIGMSILMPALFIINLLS